MKVKTRPRKPQTAREARVCQLRGRGGEGSGSKHICICSDNRTSRKSSDNIRKSKKIYDIRDPRKGSPGKHQNASSSQSRLCDHARSCASHVRVMRESWGVMRNPVFGCHGGNHVIICPVGLKPLPHVWIYI